MQLLENKIDSSFVVKNSNYRKNYTLIVRFLNKYRRELNKID